MRYTHGRCILVTTIASAASGATAPCGSRQCACHPRARHNMSAQQTFPCMHIECEVHQKTWSDWKKHNLFRNTSRNTILHRCCRGLDLPQYNDRCIQKMRGKWDLLPPTFREMLLTNSIAMPVSTLSAAAAQSAAAAAASHTTIMRGPILPIPEVKSSRVVVSRHAKNARQTLLKQLLARMVRRAAEM